MNEYEIKLADGRVVTISDREGPEHACERAADLHGQAAVAWRRPRVWVGPVAAEQIVG